MSISTIGVQAPVPGAVLYTGQPGTSDSALYTASGSGVIAAGIFVQNATESDAQVTLTVHRATSGTIEALVTSLDVPAGYAGQVLDQGMLAYAGLMLRVGDSLHGSCSAASSVSVTVHE
jgi:hypothetical protein